MCVTGYSSRYRPWAFFAVSGDAKNPNEDIRTYVWPFHQEKDIEVPPEVDLVS